MSLQKQPPTENLPSQENSLATWFMDDFWPRYGKVALIVVGVVLVVVGGFFWFQNSRENAQARENKELGLAYVYLGEDKVDSAEAFLSAFVQKSHSRDVQDKANLMLGKIQYGKGKYDEAIKSYGAVNPGDKDRALVSSGALHGLASSYIQKKDYAKAAEVLEKFVATFGVRTGNPKEKLAGKEVVDLSPVVPNALWKLTLCYKELKDNAKAKATAEKLIKIYPDSREAYEANRFLAQLP